MGSRNDVRLHVPDRGSFAGVADRHMQAREIDPQFRQPATMAAHVLRAEFPSVGPHCPEPNGLAIAANEIIAVCTQSYEPVLSGPLLIQITQIQLRISREPVARNAQGPGVGFIQPGFRRINRRQAQQAPQK